MYIVDTQNVPATPTQEATDTLDIRNVRTLERIYTSLDGYNRNLMDVVILYNGNEKCTLKSKCSRSEATKVIVSFAEQYRQGVQFFYTSTEAKRLYNGE